MDKKNGFPAAFFRSIYFGRTAGAKSQIFSRFYFKELLENRKAKDEGRIEGLAEGHSVGLAEGHSAGLAEGHSIGLIEGCAEAKEFAPEYDCAGIYGRLHGV